MEWFTVVRKGIDHKSPNIRKSQKKLMKIPALIKWDGSQQTVNATRFKCKNKH